MAEKVLVGHSRFGLDRESDKRGLELLLEPTPAGAQGGDALDVAHEVFHAIVSIVGAQLCESRIAFVARDQVALELKDSVVAVHGVLAGLDGVAAGAHVGRHHAEAEALESREVLHAVAVEESPEARTLAILGICSAKAACSSLMELELSTTRRRSS